MLKSNYVKSYLTHKVEGAFDVILIGSGISSLTTAALLAKQGKKVVVLEQHYTPGGLTHVYMRRGYEWDNGLHFRPHNVGRYPIRSLWAYTRIYAQRLRMG